MILPAHQGSAVFSPCGKHRHRLDRWWSDEPRALVCGCNPSQASAEKNDPTVLRLFDLLHGRPGIGGFTVVNADSYIATDPADLAGWAAGLSLDALNAIRVVDRAHVRVLAETAAVRIVAWGALVRPGLHANRVLAALSHDGRFPLHAFALTDAGAPKHPMARGVHRIPAGLPLEVWRPAEEALPS